MFLEEENPSEELDISEAETAALDASAVKETNVEALTKLIFIDKKSGNMRVVVQTKSNQTLYNHILLYDLKSSD